MLVVGQLSHRRAQDLLIRQMFRCANCGGVGVVAVKERSEERDDSVTCPVCSGRGYVYGDMMPWSTLAALLLHEVLGRLQVELKINDRLIEVEDRY